MNDLEERKDDLVYIEQVIKELQELKYTIKGLELCVAIQRPNGRIGHRVFSLGGFVVRAGLVEVLNNYLSESAIEMIEGDVDGTV